MGLPIHVTPAPGRYRVSVGDTVLGETAAALLLDEAGHDPVLYLPRADMDMTLFTATDHATTCPWKGQASYFSVAGLQNAVWTYERPIEAMESIAGYLAFYPSVRVERL